MNPSNAIELSSKKFRSLVSGEWQGVCAAFARLGLYAVSVPYGEICRWRNRLYDRGWLRSERVRVPVVSVGNLTLGGTGKTPCVEYIANFYRQARLRPAILSRGYGGKSGRNDEFLILSANLGSIPHYQHPDRVSQARIAIEDQASILILDDGFQHRRLKRDLDIVLIDATNPWGHGYMFPRGLLRESRDGLKRAHVVLLTRCDLVSRSRLDRLRDEIAGIAPHVTVAESTHRPSAWINHRGDRRSVDGIRDRPIVAFCGIGNPEAFRQTLARLGCDVVAFRAFADHQTYAETDVEELAHWIRQQPRDGVVVTTQKDLVKLPFSELAERELWVLRVQLQFESGQEAFDRELTKVQPGTNQGWYPCSSLSTCTASKPTT